MRSLIKSLGRVSNFWLLQDNIIYFSPGGLLTLYSLQEDVKYWEVQTDTQYLLFVFNEFILPYQQYKKIEKRSLSNGETINILNKDVFPIQTDEEGIWLESADNKDYYLTFLNIDQFREFKYSNIGDKRVLQVLKESFLSLSSTLTCCNLSSGEELWKIELNDLLETQDESSIYHQRIIAVNNKLFFWVRDKHFRKFATFVIDANTGKVLYSTEKFGGTIYLYGNYVHSIGGKGYSRMDTGSYNVEVYDLTDQLAEDDLNIESGFSFFYNDKIYFAARSGNVNLRSFLGIIDLNTQKLLWKTDLLKNPDKPADNDNRYQIEEIKANDKYIVVKTAGGTLLVFEQD